MGPWLFIKLADTTHAHSSPNPSISSTIAEDQPDSKKIHEMLTATDYEDLIHVKQKEYKIKCNWKVFVDNYLDGGKRMM
jgi:hypothetical protein